MNLETPVLFLTFNRLAPTQQVFERIKGIQPTRLYLASDGPRENNILDAEKVDAVRKYIVSNVDWECQVQTLFREKNLGCRIAVSSAIDWFFENEEMGIILEDDCLPSNSFFVFCRELLFKYQDDGRVMQISGNNFQHGILRGDGSYYFSRYNHIWGWATWKRAWQHYDVQLKSFPNFVQNKKIDEIFSNSKAKNYWIKIFEKVYRSEIDTWDYQWTYAIWNLEGCAILPNINLVKNIGLGEDSTHTSNFDKTTAEMTLGIINKIIHPTSFYCDEQADNYTFCLIYDTSLMRRILKKIDKLIYQIKLLYNRTN